MCLLNWVLSANSCRSISTTSLFREPSPHGELSSISWWTPVHNGRTCASCKHIISMWKLHLDCFQHCTCFVETLLKIAYKRTLNYMYIIFVLGPIISVIVDCMHTFTFKCSNNLSVGKVVYCYEIHSVFSWPMLTMWNDVLFLTLQRSREFSIIGQLFFYYLKQESIVKKSNSNYNSNASVKLIFIDLLYSRSRNAEFQMKSSTLIDVWRI